MRRPPRTQHGVRCSMLRASCNRPAAPGRTRSGGAPQFAPTSPSPRRRSAAGRSRRAPRKPIVARRSTASSRVVRWRASAGRRGVRQRSAHRQARDPSHDRPRPRRSPCNKPRPREDRRRTLAATPHRSRGARSRRHATGVRYRRGRAPGMSGNWQCGRRSAAGRKIPHGLPNGAHNRLYVVIGTVVDDLDLHGLGPGS